MRPAEILEKLDGEQRAAVRAPRGPVCVLAGAGTGKTRTITHRIAYLVAREQVRPGQVLAVTFTARAAGEMRTRLRELGTDGAQARTFHSAALRQLRYFWPKVVGGPPWELLDGKLGLVGRAANRLGLSTESDHLRDLASELEWSKASLVGPEQYPAAAARNRRTAPDPPERVARVYAAYETLKNDAKRLDFDDLLLHTAAALEERTEVAEEFRERYRCFVVDEYQDLTPLQQRVLVAWLGPRDDLTVVGDPNQTIYSFAGASAGPLLEFPRRFPDAATVRLQQDYRSTPQVVSLANRVISAATERPPGGRLRLVGQREPGPDPEFREFDDEPAEAAAVAGRIDGLVDAGTPASEIAVLFRVNAQSEAYEQALTERGIPYLVRGGERFFARDEVRRAMAALRTAQVSEPAAGSLPELVRERLAPIGLTGERPAGGAGRDRWESLSALVELAEYFALTVPGADLRRFVTELAARAEAAHPPKVEGVTLASLHSAKGCEWDAVFMVGIVDGTLPLQHALGDPAAIEEERRLFYVGLTRPRTRVWLSWAGSRQAGGRRNRRRSRFLDGIVPESRQHVRGGTRTPRQADAPAATVDEELLGRLKVWRSERARAMKVPAFVVFTDAVLIAVAERQPTDAAALTAIPGIGARKLEQFGAEVFALVAGEAVTVEQTA
jgi:DNA helicase-2/ATP-dependent DNA helicase PcrA